MWLKITHRDRQKYIHNFFCTLVEFYLYILSAYLVNSLTWVNWVHNMNCLFFQQGFLQFSATIFLPLKLPREKDKLYIFPFRKKAVICSFTIPALLLIPSSYAKRDARIGTCAIFLPVVTLIPIRKKRKEQLEKKNTSSWRTIRKGRGKCENGCKTHFLESRKRILQGYHLHA